MRATSKGQLARLSPLAACVAAAASLAGGCEGLVGIRDPSPVGAAQPDGGSRGADGSADSDRSDGGSTGGGDASAGSSLAFSAEPIPCTDAPAIDVALARSDPDTPQDRALIALQTDSLWICRAPYDSTDPEVIPIDTSVAQDMWVGDITGNGTDDVAVLSSDGLMTVVRFESDGTSATTGLASDYAGGDAPGFIAGGDVNGDELVDLVLVKTSISVMQNGGDGSQFGEVLETELSDPLDDATFGSLGASALPDLVFTTTIQDVSQVVVMRADAVAPQYDQLVDQRYNIALASSNVVAFRGAEGLIQRVFVVTGNGLAILRKTAEGTFEEAWYDPVDFGGPIATGDLTGDGAGDVVGIGLEQLEAGIWRSDTGLSEADAFPLFDDVTSLAIEDVNGDGLGDIVTAGPGGLIVYYQTP